jgi:hypothetical protein
MLEDRAERRDFTIRLTVRKALTLALALKRRNVIRRDVGNEPVTEVFC